MYYFFLNDFYEYTEEDFDRFILLAFCCFKYGDGPRLLDWKEDGFLLTLPRLPTL